MPSREAPVGLLREPNSYDFVGTDTIVEFPDSAVAPLRTGGAILVPPSRRIDNHTAWRMIAPTFLVRTYGAELLRPSAEISIQQPPPSTSWKMVCFSSGSILWNRHDSSWVSCGKLLAFIWMKIWTGSLSSSAD